MKDYRNIIFILVIAVFLLQILVMKEDSKAKDIKKPTISVSTFPLYDIAKHISQDKFELSTVLPTGVDIHNYKPTSEVIDKIKTSELFIYSGASLEPWIETITFKNKVLDVSQYVVLRELESDEFYIHEHHDEQCVHNKIDPHYWLDTNNMKKAANIITSEFIKLQPENKSLFLKNRDDYFAMLSNLDHLYTKELNNCYLDTIVVNHNAFSYLTKKYDFKLKSLSGFFPEMEVSSRDVIRVINDIRVNKVQTIFFENLVNNKDISNLAEDTNVDLDMLHSLVNITKEEADHNISYKDIMQANLAKISKALVCN